MKVKVLVKFIDKHTGGIHRVGEEFDCTPERYEEILSKGNFVESAEKTIVPIEETESEVKPIEDMAFAELKEYAKIRGVNIDGLKKKADILTAIKAAE